MVSRETGCAGWGCSQTAQQKRHCVLFNLTDSKHKRYLWHPQSQMKKKINEFLFSYSGLKVSSFYRAITKTPLIFNEIISWLCFLGICFSSILFLIRSVTILLVGKKLIEKKNKQPFIVLHSIFRECLPFFLLPSILNTHEAWGFHLWNYSYTWTKDSPLCYHGNKNNKAFNSTMGVKETNTVTPTRSKVREFSSKNYLIPYSEVLGHWKSTERVITAPHFC